MAPLTSLQAAVQEAQATAAPQKQREQVATPREIDTPAGIQRNLNADFNAADTSDSGQEEKSGEEERDDHQERERATGKEASGSGTTVLGASSRRTYSQRSGTPQCSTTKNNKWQPSSQPNQVGGRN